MSPGVDPVLSVRIASKLIVAGEPPKYQTWFHSMTSAGEPLKVVTLPRTIGLPALLRLLLIKSAQSGAIEAWGGLVVRSVLMKSTPVSLLAKVIRPFESTKSLLAPVYVPL